jgi:hypothetical protein
MWHVRMGRGGGQPRGATPNFFLALVSEPFGALIIYLEHLKKEKNTNIIKIKP